MDDNDNKICDNYEVEPEKEKKLLIDPLITQVLANQDKVGDDYFYEKEYYKGDSNEIDDSFKLWRKGDKYRVEHSGRIFYREGDGKVYEYIPYNNKSKDVSGT